MHSEGAYCVLMHCPGTASLSVGCALSGTREPAEYLGHLAGDVLRGLLASRVKFVRQDAQPVPQDVLDIPNLINEGI